MINRYILNNLANLVYTFNKSMRMYNVSQAAEACISFWWTEFCDNYIELIKPIVMDKQGTAEEISMTKMVLFTCIDQALRMIHVFMPFLCEEMF